MELDFNAMQENVARHNAEKAQAFNNRFHEIKEKQKLHDEEINRLLTASANRERETKRQEMECRIQEETSVAAEAIRAKYEKESPADWNEGKYAKALRQFVKNLNA